MGMKEIKSIDDIEEKDVQENKKIEKTVLEQKNLSDLPIIEKEEKTKKAKRVKIKKPAIERWATTTLVIAIIAGVLSLLPLFSTLIMIVTILVLVLVAMLSFLTLFFNKEYMKLITDTKNITEFSAKLITYSPYVLFGASGLMGISLLLTCLNKKDKHKSGAIIAKSIALTIMLALAIVLEIAKSKISS